MTQNTDGPEERDFELTPVTDAEFFKTLIEAYPAGVVSTAFSDFDDDFEPEDEDRWEPSCAMDCELCGCHGDCPDCGTEGEYEVPDDELDDLEYYGRHGYSREAPLCDDEDCMCDD